MATINTIHGPLDEAQLVKSEGDIDNDNELTHWVEYRLPDSDEIVHRSAHVVLKKELSADALQALFGNR